MFKGRSRNRGFTLIELVIVIIILGILAAVAVPKFVDITAKANEAATKAGLSSLRSAVTMFYASTAITGTARYPTGDSAVAAAEIKSVLSGPIPPNKMTPNQGAPCAQITAQPSTFIEASLTDGWAYVASTADPEYGRIYATHNKSW